ncbi:MAG TPA: substrate-binding domain-containing protein [Alphaproteobacteria bacterium]|nr:substrate-binding domain-containing protein [Alphaproteobacteria bacterium]
MNTKTIIFTAIAAAAAVGATGVAHARDQVQIVGSSTVFPFSTAVAEQIGKTSGGKTPIVESTGTGGGFKLFCSGSGDNTPDVANASRAIKSSEMELCASNKAGGIIEVKIGYDGIVLANSRSAQQINLSLKDIFLALAKEVPGDDGKTTPNPYKTWNQVNPSLPDIKIEVMGPPPTSGTRDAFVELAMEAGCKSFPWVKALANDYKDAFTKICHSIREDGAWIDAGENDNLIIQKLAANPNAMGVFGFSFLDQNTDKVQGSIIENIEPSFDNIASGAYKVSRPLYFYVKAAHLDVVPGLKPYLAEFTSEKAWGPEGYLTEKGLIPMPDEERAKIRNDVAANAKL